MNEDDNWLPPDNMQEGPVAAVAHRTSPTNMGLALLAHLAAHDFGYLSTGRMLERLERMLNAIHNLERYNGHLYNWYDTRTLEPLHPHYVSTVDNGNLAGHLLTLRPGLLELADTPVWDARALAGLFARYHLNGESVEVHANGDMAAEAVVRGLEEAVRQGMDEPSPVTDTRHAIIHAQMLGKDHIARLTGRTERQGAAPR